MTINPVVPGVRHAGTKTSGIEIGVLERVPRDRRCHASRRSLVETHATPKTSTTWSAISGANAVAAMLGVLNVRVGVPTMRPEASLSDRYVQTSSRTRCVGAAARAASALTVMARSFQ